MKEEKVKNSTLKEKLVGSYFSRTSYGVIKEELNYGSLHVCNEDGFSWSISREVFEEEMTGTNFSECKKVGKEELARICMEDLNSSYILEACFTKRDGSKRVLTGYKVGKRNYLGQMSVVDLEKKMSSEKDTGIRTIDLNKLLYIVFNGVKYEKK